MIDRDSWPIEDRPCAPGAVSSHWVYVPRVCCRDCSRAGGWASGQHCATHCPLGVDTEGDLTMRDTNDHHHKPKRDYIR